MRLLNRVRDAERGAVLILFAFLSLVLFGFMALAVDAGYAFVERRNSQNTADVAAVGAAVQAIENDGTDAEIADDIIAEAQRLVQINVGVTDWSTCSDPDALPLTWASQAAGPSNCISWNEDFRRVRVRVPNRDVDTFFASVIGFDTISIGAAAEVEGLASGLGGILPFASLTETGDGDLICLKTETANTQIPPECDPSTTGNYGYLDFSIFGGVIPGTVQNCDNNANAGSRLRENIAHGIDHEIGVGPFDENDSTALMSATKCNNPITYAGTPVNGTDTQTGNASNKVIEPGFISGANGFPGRLTVTKSSNTTTVGSTSGVDNDGLWAYLTDGARTYCSGLRQEDPPTGTNGDPRWLDIDGAPDTEDEVLSCIRYHVETRPGTKMFTGLKDSPRFGAVPILWKGWPTGTENRTFKGLATVYIGTLFGGNCKSTGSIPCTAWFEPGRPPTSNTSFDGVTAIAIPDSVVLQDDLDAIQGLPEIEEYLIVE